MCGGERKIHGRGLGGKLSEQPLCFRLLVTRTRKRDAALGRRIAATLLGAAPGHTSNPQTIMPSLSVGVAAVVSNATGFIPLSPIL